jgi:hypothetical protein
MTTPTVGSHRNTSKGQHLDNSKTEATRSLISQDDENESFERRFSGTKAMLQRSRGGFAPCDDVTETGQSLSFAYSGVKRRTEYIKAL